MRSHQLASLVIFLCSFVLASAALAVEIVNYNPDKHLNLSGLNPAKTGIIVIDVETGREVTTHNPDLLLRPASVMKLVTSAAALHYLKPEYSFTTKVYASGPIHNGVLNGDLWIEAGGDPFIVPEQLFLLARRVADTGLKQVTGKIMLDINHHEGPLRPEGWPQGQSDRAYCAPVTSLCYRFNSIGVAINCVDRRPDVTLQPPVSTFKIHNTATVGGRNSLVLSLTSGDGVDVVNLSGSAPKTFRDTFHRSVNRPYVYFVHAFVDLLEREGVTVTRKFDLGELPGNAQTLGVLSSPPLSELVKTLNFYSNNIMAEMVLRELGGKAVGYPGTTEKGIEAVQKFLQELGIDKAGLLQKDGSGLTRTNQLSARMLASLLAKMYKRFDIGPDFVASIPASGADGTMKRRLNGDMYRQIRGKTGTINGVRSLAGYMETNSGKVYAYAMILDGMSKEWLGKQVIDKICMDLVHM